MSDQAQKTEKATPRRVEQARKEGNYPGARELIAAIQFALFAALLQNYCGAWLSGMRQSARVLVRRAFVAELRAVDVARIALDLFLRNLVPLIAAGLLVVLLTIGVRLVTTKMGVSLSKLAPKADKLNPLARLRELPRQNVPAALQAGLLLPFLVLALYWLLQEQFPIFLALPFTSIAAGIARTSEIWMQLLWKAAMAFFVIGLIDFVRQKRRYEKDLRMTKQEVREENKEMEGNPHTKARIRRLQRDAARRNMMKQIPTATAVVVNPTHFAVAIRYSMEAAGAPVVVAKGKNYLALRIKRKAIEHEIPIVENPPLAQALYKSVDVGQEIPAHLYRAVAEILAYIFRLMNGRRFAQ